MALLILRVCFICVAAGIATLFLNIGLSGPAYLPYLIIFGTVLLALGVIAVDIFTPQKRIEVISAVYFGLLVGVLLTYVLWVALAPLIPAGPYAPPVVLLMATATWFAVPLSPPMSDDITRSLPAALTCTTTACW